MAADLDSLSIKVDLATQAAASFLARTNGSSQLFSSIGNGSNFIRNPGFWLRGVNGITGTHVGDGPGATAITPWHVLEADHYKLEVGSKVCFVDESGTSVIRTVVAGRNIRPDIKSDIWLGLLDSALPASIVPLPLMPTNWTNQVHSPLVPVAAMNQNRCFGLAILTSFHQPVDGWFLHGYGYRPTPLAPLLRFEPMKGGDSGHPVVTLIGTNLVLLGHITFEPGTGSMAGPDYSLYASDITAAIQSLGTNITAKAQQPVIKDLSQFQ